MACISGYGIYSNGDWQAGMFNSSEQFPNFQDDHNHWINMVKPIICPRDDNVNCWELLAVLQAVRRYCYSFCNCHVIIATDNTQVVAMVNGGSSINLSCLDVLREIFWITSICNIYITMKYVPGVQNIIADKLSRISQQVDMSFLEQFSLCCSATRPIAVGPDGGGDNLICMG